MKTQLIYIFKTLLIIFALISLNSACTDLNAPIESEFAESDFPNTDAEFVAAAGPAYKSLQERIALDYWFLQELSTDEALLRARGADWYDGGRYQQLHLHTWNADQPHILGTWQWGFKSISTCNQILKLFESAPEIPSKPVYVAEIRSIRALYYFLMMDSFGDIPLVSSLGEVSLITRTPRKDVFNFIEKELKEVIPNLSDKTDASTYGHPTKWMAYSMLAKMYLNAEVYTGTARYQDALNACNEIIKSGNYSLTADYMSVFAPNNGPTIKENIFVVPFDPIQAPNQYFARYALHTALQTKFGIPFRPTNATITTEAFYNLYSDVNDKRRAMWLAGKQYNNDGSPVIIKTTNKGLDVNYAGTDPTGPVNYHLDHTPEVTFVNPGAFSVGTHELGLAMGARNIKYYPDKNSPDRNQSNDFVIFRYGDILLMKAEAILQGATDSEGKTALELVNQIRTRAGVAAFVSVDLNNLFEERSREMAWEGWRRNDLIRFGKWEDSWLLKTDKDPNHRIFPVPTTEKTLNPNLGQNPGY